MLRRGLVLSAAVPAPQSTVDQQRAVASAGAADLTLLPLSGQIPAPPIPANLASFQIPGGPAADLTPAIAALLTPPAELLSLQSVTSRAVGQCTSGQPALTATSAATGLRVLGRDVAGNVVDQALTVTEAQSLDLSRLDLSKVTLPGGATLPPALTAPLRRHWPRCRRSLPAQVGRLTVRRGEEVRTAGRLTRRALHFTLALGGQTLLDAVLGEASVGVDGVTCGGAAQVAAERRCSARSAASFLSTCSSAGAA